MQQLYFIENMLSSQYDRRPGTALRVRHRRGCTCEVICQDIARAVAGRNGCERDYRPIGKVSMRFGTGLRSHGLRSRSNVLAVNVELPAELDLLDLGPSVGGLPGFAELIGQSRKRPPSRAL